MDIVERVTERYVVLRQGIGHVTMAHRMQYTVADARAVLSSIAEAVHWERLAALSTLPGEGYCSAENAKIFWRAAEAAIRASQTNLPPFHIS